MGALDRRRTSITATSRCPTDTGSPAPIQLNGFSVEAYKDVQPRVNLFREDLFNMGTRLPRT